MTKTKAQKAKAKAKRANQQQQTPKKAGKAPRRSRAQRRNTSSDNSQTRGGNGSALKSGKPKTGVVARTELIQLVNGSTGFTVLKFPINPGLAGTFPIGATEAKNYTDWKMKFMKVDYIPTVSEFATQGQQGEVVIAVDYNADNIVPTAMNQVEDMEPAGGGIPSKGFSFDVVPEYANKSDPKYVRTGAAPIGDDLRLYDGGNLYFAVSGCTNATQIGKLMVTYYFDVMLPTLLNQGGANSGGASAAFFQATSPGENSAATTVAKQMLFATATLNGAGIVNTAGSFVPPAGTYATSVNICAVASGILLVSTKVDIQKNGVTVFQVVPIQEVQGGSSSLEISADVLIACNGTDAITVVVTDGFTGGTVLNTGTIVFGSVA